jgi:pimeloyl-ACP methyl ester carboxylesterase
MTIANKYYRTLEAYGIDKALAEGQAWYPNAWKFCLTAARFHNITPERVAAVVAVTSPRTRWQKNIQATAEILEDVSKPVHKRQKSYGILGANAAKGILIANDRYYSRHVTGAKVTNFYLNILGHTNPITVDSIMSKAAGYGSDVNNSIRSEVEAAVHTMCPVFDMNPRDMQAAVWIAYRGSAA